MRTMVDKMDELTIRTDNLENSPVLVNLAGYMNKDAGAFFTLVDGKKK
jgi:hypothetical protein